MEGVKRLAGLCLIIILTGTVRGQICTRHWKLHDDTYYIEVSMGMSHDEAEKNCQEMGAELAILKSPDENNFVEDLSCRPVLALYRYWIGMTDRLIENDFQWEDGTQLNPRNAQWGPGEPNNRWDQDCVAFITSPDFKQQGRWSTEVCSSKLFSLCSKPLVLPELSNPPDVSEIGTDSFRLSWRCWNEAEDNGDGPVLGYRVKVNTVQDPMDANWRTAGFVLGGDPCEIIIEHLHINTEYYTAVSVLHGDSRREGPLGPRLGVRTRDVDLPFLLEPPEALSIGTSYLMITWTRWTATNGEGDGPIAGYNVHIIDGTVPRKLAYVGVGESKPEYNVTGLQADTAYHIMITVTYQDGREGPPGPILSVSTTTSAPGPDIIQPAKTCEKAASFDTRWMWLVIPLSFGAGMAIMFLCCWCRRGTIYIKNDTSQLLPDRHDKPTYPDTVPPSYNEYEEIPSLPCAGRVEPRSNYSNYVCLRSNSINIIDHY